MFLPPAVFAVGERLASVTASGLFRRSAEGNLTVAASTASSPARHSRRQSPNGRKRPFSLPRVLLLRSKPGSLPPARTADARAPRARPLIARIRSHEDSGSESHVETNEPDSAVCSPSLLRRERFRARCGLAVRDWFPSSGCARRRDERSRAGRAGGPRAPREV